MNQPEPGGHAVGGGAVFAEHALARLPEVSAQQVAGRVEWVADETSVVVADADGRWELPE